MTADEIEPEYEAPAWLGTIAEYPWVIYHDDDDSGITRRVNA